MYPVSDEFSEKIQDNHRKYYWTGCITTTSGTEYPISYENIIKNSGYITRQCSGSTELEIGSVYASELVLTVMLEIDRYTLAGAEIKLYYHLELYDGTEEIIPMGIFEVVEANRHIKTIEIKAYDYMLRFDKVIDVDLPEYGSPLTYIELACEQCEVELESNPSIVNRGLSFTLSSDHDITTYRDLLYYSTQLTGCVCDINRFGVLELRPYGIPRTYQVPTQHRFSSVFSDYQTKYTEINATQDNHVLSYALEENDGLTIDLGKNPFIQVDIHGYLETALKNILDIFYLITYTPFESSTIGNPALDPMDCISNTGGHADDEALSVISHIVYRIGGKQTLKCVGSNPKLAQAKSSLEKVVDSVLSGDSSDSGGSGDDGGSGDSEGDGTSCACVDQSIIYLHYTNSSSYIVQQTAVTVISKEFRTWQDTSVLFHGTIGLEVSGVDDTAEMTLTYRLNESSDVLSDVFELTKTVSNGKDFLTLFFSTYELTQDTTNQLKVEMQISSGTMTIEAKKIRATLQGQYILADEGYWSGILEVSDVFSDIPIEFTDFTVDSFEGVVAIEERHAGGKEKQCEFTTIFNDIPIELLEMEVTGDV